ncbi:hypothetical protein ACFL6M_01890 [Candidatus Eisenbacteria bacterium]|uniref:Cupin n=1 Tax=Eiseniibacteriota bacterium TaxID=2212470 RepID=A0ABV6YJ03_UNCEI
MKYTRVFADIDGESHFEDVEVEMKAIDFAPPAPPLSLSDFVEATQFAFLRAPAGWVGDWHPAPRRQMMIYLAGQIEGHTSDGRQRTFGPGSAVLVEDTTGKGHRSRVLGTEDVLMAVVQLSEGDAAG